MNKKELHQKALEAARKYRRCEIELIEILEKVDAAKVYLHHGCNSTFRYAVDVLKLSEAVALIFIKVSRKTREVPELKNEIRDGNITVNKAQKMSSVLTLANSDRWIEKAKSSSTRQLEKAVAAENPKEAVPEKTKYVSKDRLDLQLGVSEELILKLRHVQDLLSQKKGRHVDLEEALGDMTDEFIERHDPLKKAERQKARGKLQSTLHVKSGRRSLPAQIKHQVFLESGGKCMHEGCGSRRHLQIHHIVPISMGGSNQPDNLKLLCSGHHHVVHLSKPPKLVQNLDKNPPKT